MHDKVRFCYDKDPEIIYFRRDIPGGRTIIEARSLDNRIRALFDFPGQPDPTSLSCSIDGSTIVALNDDKDHLYILQAAQLWVYVLKPTVDNFGGSYSLLSPDGTVVGL
jgi:hypothetical protein